MVKLHSKRHLRLLQEAVLLKPLAVFRAHSEQRKIVTRLLAGSDLPKKESVVDSEIKAVLLQKSAISGPTQNHPML